LPESLARNLDATEYLGPVKIISSYQDPAARTTVRVDVDLAEDVPNRIALGRHAVSSGTSRRRKAQPAKRFGCPPSVMFVPARKVAGFFACGEGWAVAGPECPALSAPPGNPPPVATTARPRLTQDRHDPRSPLRQQPRLQKHAKARRRGFRRADYATIGKKRYTGRRIDLDFKGADIHNILRLLADVGQVNVIVADDVRGEVTIKMRDVPWDQALDVVLRSKGLGSVREGNLLRVAPLALLEKELEAEIARQKQIADVLPIETRLIGVSYAEAGS
jgi:type IV pilus assembly protein PilQ